MSGATRIVAKWTDNQITGGHSLTHGGNMKYLIIAFIAAVVIAFILAMVGLIFNDASDTWRKLF